MKTILTRQAHFYNTYIFQVLSKYTLKYLFNMTQQGFVVLESIFTLGTKSTYNFQKSVQMLRNPALENTTLQIKTLLNSIIQKLLPDYSSKLCTKKYKLKKDDKVIKMFLK